MPWWWLLATSPAFLSLGLVVPTVPPEVEAELDMKEVSLSIDTAEEELFRLLLITLNTPGLT